MAGNTFGKIFRLTSFGESHGKAIGGIIDGCPAGFSLSTEKIAQDLQKRRPGQSECHSMRNEADQLEILSGTFEGKTTGMPIGFLVYNTDCKPSDYSGLRELYRPSHADYSWEQKYGIRDHSGGGRASAREHIARVVGGAIAKQILEKYGIHIQAYTSQVGTVSVPYSYRELELEKAGQNAVRCPDPEAALKMENLLREIRETGDSVGGIASCVIKGVMPGLGEPVFDRFQARLAQAMLSINAAKGFEYGEGFAAAALKGSEHNDPFVMKEGKIRTETNFSGGIQGGVSNGEDIYFRVAFKPISSIAREQDTVSVHKEEITFECTGRHDPCAVPRAIVVVEAMAAMTVLDLLLENQHTRFRV